MHVALVAAAYGDPWDESQVVARRLAGALACGAEVDVLIPGGASSSTSFDGAVRVVRFQSSSAEAARRAAWRRIVLGPADADSLSCSCRGVAEGRLLPPPLEEEVLLAEGGHSPSLYDHLGHDDYDVVVFVGLHSPATYWGARALPRERRVVLVPSTMDRRVLSFGLHTETVLRADQVVVFTERERSMWEAMLGGEQHPNVENIRFLVGVNPLARLTDPHDFDRGRYVVVPGEWTKRPIPRRLNRWAELVEDAYPDVRLRLVGPGAERSPLGIRLTGSCIDMWRWMSRSVAVLDPTLHTLIGQHVLEAFLFQTPVIVQARGGATREHADIGDGGLWFRTDEEFCAVVGALLDADFRRVLGEQGCSYAEQYYADTDGFIKQVGETFLS